MPVTGDYAALARLSKRLQRLGSEGTLRIAAQVAQETRLLAAETFQRGVSPDGQAWAPLRVRSGQPLRDSGRLATSLTVTYAGLTFTVGTNVGYAGVHQYGATVTVKNKRSLYSQKQRRFFGKTVTIPARPFLPTGTALPSAWQDRLNEAAAEALDLLFR